MPEKTPQPPISETAPVASSPEAQQEAQVEPPPPLGKAKLQKKKILIGLGVFLGVLILSGAVFGVYKYVQRKIPFEPVGEPTPTLIATPTPDPTADWETYTNTKVGFSLKYPQTLTPSECKDGLHLFESISGLKASEFCETPPLGKISLEYSITPFSPGYSQSIEFEVKEEEIVLGNTKAIKQTIKKIKEVPGPDYAVLVTFSKDDYYFLVSLRDKQYEDTFNLILSTFKFLEEGKVELKTYRSDKYNFEFKYPPNCELKESFSKTSAGYDWLFINLAKEENMPPPGTLPHIQISVVKSVEPKDFSFYEWTEVVGKITIGGIEAEIRQHKSTDQKEAVFLKEGKTFEIISMNYSEDSSQEEVFDQILSTFRFLD